MHSLTPAYLDSLRFDARQLDTLTRIGAYQGKQALYGEQLPDVLEALLRIARIESSESSNRIEGIEAPRSRIESLVTRSTAPANRSEQEIAGYRDALELVHESARELEPSTAVIRRLHELVYGYLPQQGGQWKTADNQIIERHLDGTTSVRFRPVSAADTPQAMEQLTSGVALALRVQRRPALVIAPLAVLDFLCIHPFADGNGRTARLLSLLLLYRADHHVGRFISLERVVEQSRETYYEALRRSSQGWHEGRHDPHPWLDYFWGVLLRAYGEFAGRVGDLRGGRGAKSERVRAAVGRMIKPFTLSELHAECPGTSLPTVKRELAAMKDEGLVMLEGRGRGARWRRIDTTPR